MPLAHPIDHASPLNRLRSSFSMMIETSFFTNYNTGCNWKKSNVNIDPVIVFVCAWQKELTWREPPHDDGFSSLSPETSQSSFACVPINTRYICTCAQSWQTSILKLESLFAAIATRKWKYHDRILFGSQEMQQCPLSFKEQDQTAPLAPPRSCSVFTL